MNTPMTVQAQDRLLAMLREMPALGITAITWGPTLPDSDVQEWVGDLGMQAGFAVFWIESPAGQWVINTVLLGPPPTVIMRQHPSLEAFEEYLAWRKSLYAMTQDHRDQAIQDRYRTAVVSAASNMLPWQ